MASETVLCFERQSQSCRIFVTQPQDTLIWTWWAHRLDGEQDRMTLKRH